MVVMILLAANLLALAGVAAWFLRLQQRAREVRALAERLAGQVGALPRALRAAVGEPAPATPFYTIEFLDPVGVAAHYSKLGAVFGSVTPAIVRREVYRQALGRIRDELAVRGIVADVRLHAR
jgi:hypothetical protein